MAQNLPSNQDLVNQAKQALQTAGEISAKVFALFPNPADIAAQLFKFVPPELLEQVKSLSSALIPGGDLVEFVASGLEKAADSIEEWAKLIPSNEELAQQYSQLVPASLAELAKVVPQGVMEGIQEILGAAPTANDLVAAYSAQLRSAAKAIRKIGAALAPNPNFLQE